MTRPRMIAGIAIAGVLAAALRVLIQRSRDTAYNPADAPVQTPAIVSPPIGPEPTATASEPGETWEAADPLAPAPQIDLTGEDFDRIWRDLIAYGRVGRLAWHGHVFGQPSLPRLRGPAACSPGNRRAWSWPRRHAVVVTVRPWYQQRNMAFRCERDRPSRREQDGHTVAVALPPTQLPGLGIVGNFTWETSHSEQVDQYRDFPSR